MHSETLDQQVWGADNNMHRDPFCPPQSGREKDKNDGEAKTAGNSFFLTVYFKK